MKRYIATREIVGHGVAINGQSSVLGSEMRKYRHMGQKSMSAHDVISEDVDDDD